MHVIQNSAAIAQCSGIAMLVRALCRDFATHDKKVLTIAAAPIQSMRQARHCSMIRPR
jgi:hypothetical protein